jgi:hypothetical protein
LSAGVFRSVCLSKFYLCRQNKRKSENFAKSAVSGEKDFAKNAMLYTKDYQKIQLQKDKDIKGRAV